MQNMVRNRSLARAISDCGWGAFRRLLAYKAARAGRHLIVIGRWYPSSKTCSACGHLLAELRPPGGRAVEQGSGREVQGGPADRGPCAVICVA